MRQRPEKLFFRFWYAALLLSVQMKSNTNICTLKCPWIDAESDSQELLTDFFSQALLKVSTRGCLVQ